MFRHANPSNLRGSLLESYKDHLLNQPRSDLAKQELTSSPSTSASVNYNDKRKSKDWRHRNAQCGFVEPRPRTSSTTRRIIYERKRFPKYSNPKYARNVRN